MNIHTPSRVITGTLLLSTVKYTEKNKKNLSNNNVFWDIFNVLHTHELFNTCLSFIKLLNLLHLSTYINRV